jgi:hypothetical protein
MNDPGDNRPAEPESEDVEGAGETGPPRSDLMRMLGCLGKILLVFVALVLLVFGACLMMLYQ